MIESGTVIELHNGHARVRVQPEGGEACKTCAGNCCSGSRFELQLPAPDGAQVGDQVKIEVVLPNPAWSAFILFLMPLVLLMAGVGLWMRFGPKPSNQGKGLLVGLGLMVLWYIGVAVYDRKLRKHPKHQPRVIEWSRPET